MSPVEREVKLGAWPGLELPDFAAEIPGVTADPLAPVRLDATYYDTADLRLTRAGASLRHRAGDGDAAWTVKLAEADAVGQTIARREVSFSGSERRVPAEAASLVRGLTRGAPLAAVARLRTERRRIRLLAADGAAWAEVDDDEVSVVVGRRVASRFREVEVELAPGGDPSILDEAVAALRRAGATASDPTPKVVRALGPAALGPPDVSPPARRRPATIGEVVTATVASSVAALLAHDAGVRLGEDPEAVHKARVATRRLRSDLRTMRALLDEAWVAGLRDELRWIAGLLGAVRDADVLSLRLQDHVGALAADDREGAAPLLDRLTAHRTAARTALLTGMDSARYTDLLEQLVVATREPFIGPDVDPDHGPDGLAELVLRPWRHLAAAVDALDPDGGTDDALHEIRIRAKRCRYASEAVAPVVGKAATAFAAAVADVQTVLGDFHDALVAEAWIRDACRAETSPAVAFVAGQLVARERDAAAAARAAWPAAWARASARKRRRWIPGA